MRQQESAEAGIAHRAYVCAGIAEAKQGLRVRQHLAHGIERTVVVVEDGEVDEVVASARGKVVV